MNVALGLALDKRSSSTSSFPPADFTFSKKLTVGSTGTRYGFKSGNYGQWDDLGAGVAATWEDESLVEFWVEQPSTYRSLITFSPGPFKTYTSLFFTVDELDYFEIVVSGSSYWQSYTSDATLAAIHDRLSTASQVDVVIQARS